MAEEVHETVRNILEWEQNLSIPEGSNLSLQAVSLIEKLLANYNNRISMENLKTHHFFQGIDWDRIRKKDAPLIPNLNLDNLKNFF